MKFFILLPVFVFTLSFSPKLFADSGFLWMNGDYQEKSLFANRNRYTELVPGKIAYGPFPFNEDDIQFLKTKGIISILNLRDFRTSHKIEEAAEVRAAGLNYLNVELSAVKPIMSKDVERAIEFIDNPENQPVYVHCLAGIDRTGAMIAIYAYQKLGCTQAQAEELLVKTGIGPQFIWLHRAFDNFVYGDEAKNKKNSPSACPL